ncbi:MAG: NAD-dependent deacylase [Pseudomonadota bacterium]
MEHIVILTGAGVSAESGLGTFRDADGLWTKYDLEDVATPQGYARNPDLVLDFYNARRANCRGAEPNDAHYALARLAREFDGHVTLITQNIDDLHERGGSPEVIHMHGELMRALCAACGHQWDWREDMSRADTCDRCSAAGAVRPDVVWFGEMPYHMDRIGALLTGATQFVAIGTSGAVYPAAGFVTEARMLGISTLEINFEASDNTKAFDRRILGPATEAVPRWVESLIGS